MKIIDKLAFIEIQNQKVLSTRSKGKDKYYIPGGKREQGESDHQALIREIKEELNVELQEDSLNYIGTFTAQAHGHAEGILVQMTCYEGEYIGDLKASSEIAEFVWLDSNDMDDISPVDILIFDWLKKENKID